MVKRAVCWLPLLLLGAGCITFGSTTSPSHTADREHFAAKDQQAVTASSSLETDVPRYTRKPVRVEDVTEENAHEMARALSEELALEEQSQAD